MISASLLATPGASKIYKGGVTVSWILYNLVSSTLFISISFFILYWDVTDDKTLAPSMFTRRSLLVLIKLANLPFQLYTLESRIAYAGWTEENLKDYKGPTPDLVAGASMNCDKDIYRSSELHLLKKSQA